ncbi:LacI family DNA-binding transcriptional regulator [Paenibacillus segetis]|uniref:LacI family transcriptional regulator n=1 Tax=Paenibacillus segetis TaxID=1325360 RepID=A0ABQ1YUQ9_9BACL|nr:LacI family DNA-binding transcriptional regulator [Paenibacillus segetis]GGH36769.1 LacI family transcriptional regulator [Paenibacillus segetis]
MKVSIFDVAKRSGLSVVTVSRVLNNSTSVREKNRLKVLEAMKELDYHPNAAARSLARGETRIIGLIVTTLKDSFLDEIVREITIAAAAQGYFVALSVSSDSQDKGHYLFQEDRVDGVLLLSPMREDEYVLELKKSQIPFVMLDNQHANSPATSVIVDNFKGGYEATKHLIDLGHKEIAHIGGPELFLSSRERERGFLTALEESGLKPFSIERGEFEISTGYTIARSWIEAGNMPTALFAGDDYIALGAMNAFTNEGIRVPGDISIIGFDDQMIASQIRPMLTTMRQPADQIGRTGVELLLKNISGVAKRNVTVQLSPELVVRESTSPRL